MACFDARLRRKRTLTPVGRWLPAPLPAPLTPGVLAPCPRRQEHAENAANGVAVLLAHRAKDALTGKASRHGVRACSQPNKSPSHVLQPA